MLKLHVMLCILYSALINGLNGTSIELGFDAMFPLFALLPFLSDACDVVFASFNGARTFYLLQMSVCDIYIYIYIYIYISVSLRKVIKECCTSLNYY